MRTFTLAAAMALAGYTAAAHAGGISKPAALPSASRPGDDPFTGVNLALDISGSDAKAEGSISGYFAHDRNSSPGDGPRTDISWKLAVAVPAGGKDDILDRATLDKLGDGTKISAGLNLLRYAFHSSLLETPAFNALMDQARKACAAKAKTDADAQYCKDAKPRESFITEYAPWLRLAMNRASFSGFWAFGADGSLSIHRYKYYTAGTLTENSAHPNGYSATIHAIYYPADAVSAWKLEAEYSDAPKAADDGVICKSPLVSPKDDCKSGAPSAPTREKSLVLRSGYMRYFPLPKDGGGIGVALTASKDTMSSDYGVELPLYFTIPKVSEVSPGVKFGYASKDHKRGFTASIFLKTSFGFQ